MNYCRIRSSAIVATSLFNTCLVAGTLLAACLGCGGTAPPKDNRAVVSGAVTFAGQPLRGGSISFETATEGSTTYIRPDGTYKTDRVPIGKNIVTIETESLKYGNPAAMVPIPAKYNDLRTSGLKVEIKPGENENVDFPLEK